MVFRGIVMIGLSFFMGMGVIFLPGRTDLAPESIRFMAKNGIIVAGLTATTLNLLFRLGTSRPAALKLDPDAGGPHTQKIVEFVEKQGGIWAARRDTVRRAAQAVLEAAAAIPATGASRRLLEVRGSFAEFNLTIDTIGSASLRAQRCKHQ